MELIDCPVAIRQGVSKFGTFANAFRVVPETGNECFLDFCVFSAQENRAEVVARLRVHRSFLPVIRDTLLAALRDLTPFELRDGSVLRNGSLVLFRTEDE